MKRVREITIGAALALMLVAAAAGTAQAEIGFTQPQTILPGDAALEQTVVDPQGRITVVSVGPGEAPETRSIQVVQLSATGLPGPVHTLDQVRRDPPFGQCPCPRLAVDPSGQVTVVWQTLVEGDRRIALALIGADGVPRPRKLLTPAGIDAGFPRVAANSEGQAAIAWTIEGSESRLEIAQIDPEGNPGETHLMTEPGEGGILPDLAAAPDGTFRVTWGNGAEPGVNTTVLDENGAPEEIQNLSPEGSLPKVVIDSEGRATIGWYRDSDFNEAKAVRLAADGTPGTVWTLSPSGQNVGDLRLAVDGLGRVTVVWEDFEQHVFGIRLGADGVPGTPHQLSPAGQAAGDPRVAAAGDGRVVVVWNHPTVFFVPEEACGEVHFEPAGDVVQAAWLGPDGLPERILDVSAHGMESQQAQVALDPLGLPWVTWVNFDGAYFCIEEDNAGIQISHALESQPPTGESANPPPVQPQSPPSGPAPTAPKLHLAKRGIAREGRVLLKARCPGESAGTCAGEIRLLVPRSAGPLARGSYRVAAGRSRRLSLPISRAARRTLAEGSFGRIAAEARGRGLTTKTVLIRVVGATN